MSGATIIPLDAVGWIIVLGATGVVLFLFICAATMLQGYLEPKYGRMRKAEVKDPNGIDYKPCCPPGLGCNDRGASKAPCRRAVAYQLADVEEVQQLDQHWSSYCKAPSRARLETWETYRDTLIETHLGQLGQPAQRAFLGVTNRIQVGEIESPKPRPPANDDDGMNTSPNRWR